MPFLDVEHLKKVKGERKKVSFSGGLPVLPVDNDDIKILSPARFELTLTNTGSAIAVEGCIEVSLQVCCARCLGDFTLVLQPEFAETYYDEARYAPDGKGEDWVAYSGNVIDITPEALGAIMLALPIRFLCSDDCRGLCSLCGTNLNEGDCHCVQDNTDPRLAKLKELLE